MVGNLSFETTDEDLGGFFDEKCENCDAVKLLTDRATGRSKGMAFVKFTTAESCAKALEFNGTDFGGRTIRVEKSRPKPVGAFGG